jgi:hypothetical protein
MLPLSAESTTPVLTAPVLSVVTEPTDEKDAPTPSTPLTLKAKLPASAAVENALEVCRSMVPLPVPFGSKRVISARCALIMMNPSLKFPALLVRFAMPRPSACTE